MQQPPQSDNRLTRPRSSLPPPPLPPLRHNPERVQESLTPILDSLTQSTISLLSENMSQMMKESVSQHFSDKKPAANITSGQLTALLLRTFPNLSESKAKNVATRLVALAKKRV